MSDLITANLVLLDENLGDTRFDVIAKLAEAVVKAGRATDFEQLYAAAEARESKTDTGIPGGIAIPHCRSAAVTEPTLAMARPNPAVSFGAKDGPADLIFFIAAPDGADQAHLKLLSTLARSLMKKSFTAALREASSADEVVDLVNGALGVGEKKAEAKPAEAAPAAAEKEAPKASESASAVKKIVAVTACPTGIAHTYMAADALKYAAEELGYDLKVETQGSSGNETLSQADIDAADAVIFAVSVNVRDRNRFAGKPFVESPVKRGIDEPKEMIAEALAEAENPNGARVAAAASTSDDSAGASEGAWGSRIYKAVMTGISYMIPFVAAGGILVALGFVFEAITMPNLGDVDTKAILGSATLFNLGDVHWTLYLGAVLQTIGGFGLSLMVPALAAYIAYGLAQRPGIAGLHRRFGGSCGERGLPWRYCWRYSRRSDCVRSGHAEAASLARLDDARGHHPAGDFSGCRPGNVPAARCAPGVGYDHPAGLADLHVRRFRSAAGPDPGCHDGF